MGGTDEITAAIMRANGHTVVWSPNSQYGLEQP